MTVTSHDPNRPRHLGGDVHCASVAIRRALDAYLMARVSPELTGARGMVLGFIARRTSEGVPVYQRDIEQRFNIRRSSVTALLKAMEQNGYITRTSVERDARLKSLALTKKGQACHQSIRTCIDDFETALRKDIPPEQLAALYEMLDQLQKNANALQVGRTHEL